MKVLFLDIDGVLNTPEMLTIENGYRYICPDRVKLIKKVVDATDCKIVLSSAWRTESRELNMVREALAKENLSLFSETPQCCEYPRSTEIVTWLMYRENIDKYAVIDDFEDAGERIETNLFLTHESTGLTEDIASNIIKHLNGN